MLLKNTIKAKIFSLTTTKKALLQQDYDAWQSWLRYQVSLYSATKQQAIRLLRSLGKHISKTKMHPMILRRDCVRLERAKEATWSDWRFKVPVASLHGGLWYPIQMPQSQERLIDEWSIRECKLVRKGDHWSLHIMVQKEVEEPFLSPSQPILAVDLSEVRPATAVLL